jgi:hypothetical protein
MPALFPALSKGNRLMSIVFSDPNAVQDPPLSYPVDTGVAQFTLPVIGTGAQDYKFQIIVYNGAPGTSFTNAPKGTLFVDISTPKFWMKTGEIGTDTWVGATAS